MAFAALSRTADLVSRYMVLTKEVLPQMARDPAVKWPVRNDHCFQRIVLDNVCEGPWFKHLTRPAYKSLSRGVPSTWRDVFLDNDVNESSITRAFERLLRIARRRGTALAIGHPNEQTLAVLAALIPRLDAYGIRLVPVAELIRTRGLERPPFPAATRFRASSGIEDSKDYRRAVFSADRNQLWSFGRAASTR